MGDYNIFYLCDRKACEKCHEECHHTSDIKHAVHRDDLEGRMFELQGPLDFGAFFEVE